MFLSTDEQTIEDLGLFGNRNNGGIYDIYNAANTRGGEAILKDMFRNPLSDRDAINQRSSIIEHFARLNMAFPFSASSFDMAEKYLLDNVEQSKGTNQQTSMLSEKEMLNGVSAVIDILWTAKTFIENRDVASVFAYKT
ncbi:MAG: DNA mismatch repair protein, partial [Mucilaginibacter sp.]|nr:DNA mismatch repair protein [Mucilaginibacter sp.]